MSLSFPDSLSDLMDHVQLYDENYKHDTLALLPVVGVPFAYNQARQGRGNWQSSLASLGIGVGMTEAAYFLSMRGAGYSSTEIALARAGSAMGFRFGGRGLTGLMLFGPRTAAGLSWALPYWFWPFAAYEIWQAGDWWVETGQIHFMSELAADAPWERV